ncbi:hypothetical protein DAI22_10g165500 [Oryza sativa Japonica Group]|nr:hypothetical protein DAI22_10g165500 [Oryza sativa Japonica Group]
MRWGSWRGRWEIGVGAVRSSLRCRRSAHCPLRSKRRPPQSSSPARPSTFHHRQPHGAKSGGQTSRGRMMPEGTTTLRTSQRWRQCGARRRATPRLGHSSSTASVGASKSMTSTPCFSASASSSSAPTAPRSTPSTAHMTKRVRERGVGSGRRCLSLSALPACSGHSTPLRAPHHLPPTCQRSERRVGNDCRRSALSAYSGRPSHTSPSPSSASAFSFLVFIVFHY